MKKKRLKKNIIIILIAILLLIGAIVYFKFFNSSLILNNNVKMEINSKHTIKEYIKSSKNVTVDKSQVINTSKLGKQKIIISYKSKQGKKKNINFSYTVVDTKKPSINIDDTITLSINCKEEDLKKMITTSDNSKGDVSVKIDGEYDLTKEGEYKIKVVAEDKSGNKATKEVTLNIKKEEIATSNDKKENKSAENNQVSSNNKLPYYIKINRKQNVVMVYGLENGEYTKLVKVFTCSTGKATPVGTFNTTDKYEWRPLFGDVYGQYATRITGSILFHSVPYTKQSKDSLEWEEYNKLGTPASMGCIRLQVADVKWIYDNCPKGTTVTIYDSDSLDGIEKPTIKLIDGNSQNKGWDPTDPDPLNPW